MSVCVSQHRLGRRILRVYEHWRHVQLYQVPMLFSGDLITLRTRATGMERLEVMITSCIGREIDDVER